MKEKSTLKDVANNYLTHTEQNKGITLLALVITIIIIIILATVAINFAFGKNGLITQAQRAKLEYEIATARETLTMILGDAFVEKKTNLEYDQDEFLDEFIKEREPNVYLEEDEIGLDGYVFSLNRSVPELGEYIGEQTEPRIKEIKVTEETTNSVSIEVSTVNATGAEYTYSYKKESEREESWQEVETSNNNTCTIGGLQQGETYNIKVVVTTKEGSIEETINVYLGEIPTGTVTFTNLNWKGDGTASVQINTTAEGYRIRYKIDNGNWIETTNGGTISNLQHGNTVYGQLWDGTNNSGEEDATVTIEDDIPPEISSFTATNVTYNSITVKVNASDVESGLNGTYTYYLNGGNAITSMSDSYTFNNLNSNTEYTIKVEVEDRAEHVISEITLATTKDMTISDIIGGEDFSSTTVIRDDLNNEIKIPGDFHLASDSGTKVQDGIVIEDAKGNQFVWIPVGNYQTTTGIKTNTLSRREFNSSGAEEIEGDNEIWAGPSAVAYGEGYSNDTLAYNTIGAFKTSATNSKGFYIGRYEQGQGNVCKAGVNPYLSYENITESKKLAETMYEENIFVKSELISSYAWDTALNFMCQNSSVGYTLAVDNSSGNVGGDRVTATGGYPTDKHSNIYDIVGNVPEWSTEYAVGGNGKIGRGANYHENGNSACTRDARNNNGASERIPCTIVY